MNIIVEFYPQENSLFQFSLSHLSLEKLEKENGLNFYCTVAQPSKWPGPNRHLAWPCSLARALCHPGRNVGLGRQSAAARSPAWANEWPASSPPSTLIRRSPGLFARTKTGVAAGNPRNFTVHFGPANKTKRPAAHFAQHMGRPSDAGGPAALRTRASPAQAATWAWAGILVARLGSIWPE